MTAPSVIRSNVITLLSYGVLPSADRTHFVFVDTDSGTLFSWQVYGGEHGALLADPSILRYFRDICIARDSTEPTCPNRNNQLNAPF